MPVSKEKVLEVIEVMHALKYYPQDPSGVADRVLAGILRAMADSDAQLDWLSSQLLNRIGHYPGPAQIRALFCTRFKPADGIECDVDPRELPGIVK
jgi:hypothetical protein